MISRPVDSSDDILPVLSTRDLLFGPAALAAGLQDHLHLFPGDWWEKPESGNPIFDMIAISRRTQKDADTLCSALTAYIQSYPEVQSVTDIQSSFSGHQFIFSCTVHLESGDSIAIDFSA